MKRLANSCNCERLHLWTDGQPFRQSNGSYDSYATVVIDDGAGSLAPGTLYAYRGIGNKTSNESEYSAVILALEWALANRERVHVITDSNLILGHIERGDHCTFHLAKYRDRVRELLAETRATLTWQPRDTNKAGWVNATVLIDRKKEKTRRDRTARAARQEKAIAWKDKRLRTPVSTKEQQAERRKWAYQIREDDDELRHVS